ncbi:uncharacterized protein LOC34621459 [Cyclospora cayetanensis]|uniref:Uncharacterized protein LOC34621459 n=1 Tax=Cyclospora cayetanensis TaxID=88456 RepID=A0A6P6RW53_9EIME|nr:uncharacterized protein LOC34621459 [Cyclospora cayetanensis]
MDMENLNEEQVQQEVNASCAGGMVADSSGKNQILLKLLKPDPHGTQFGILCSSAALVVNSTESEAMEVNMPTHSSNVLGPSARIMHSTGIALDTKRAGLEMEGCRALHNKESEVHPITVLNPALPPEATQEGIDRSHDSTKQLDRQRLEHQVATVCSNAVAGTYGNPGPIPWAMPRRLLSVYAASSCNSPSPCYFLKNIERPYWDINPAETLCDSPQETTCVFTGVRDAGVTETPQKDCSARQSGRNMQNQKGKGLHQSSSRKPGRGKAASGSSLMYRGDSRTGEKDTPCPFRVHAFPEQRQESISVPHIIGKAPHEKHNNDQARQQWVPDAWGACTSSVGSNSSTPSHGSNCSFKPKKDNMNNDSNNSAESSTSDANGCYTTSNSSSSRLRTQKLPCLNAEAEAFKGSVISGGNVNKLSGDTMAVSGFRAPEIWGGISEEKPRSIPTVRSQLLNQWPSIRSPKRLEGSSYRKCGSDGSYNKDNQANCKRHQGDGSALLLKSPRKADEIAAVATITTPGAGLVAGPHDNLEFNGACQSLSAPSTSRPTSPHKRPSPPEDPRDPPQATQPENLQDKAVLHIASPYDSSLCLKGSWRPHSCRRARASRMGLASAVAALNVLSPLEPPEMCAKTVKANNGEEESQHSGFISDPDDAPKISVATLTLDTASAMREDLPRLYEVAGIRDASQVNLVDSIELIMDRCLGPRSLEALGAFCCLRQLRLVRQQITSLEHIGVCKNLQVLHLPENRISSLDGLESLKLLEDLDLSVNRISALEAPAYRTDLGEVIQHPSDGLLKNFSVGPLSALQRLQTLRLNSNRVKTLRGIERLVNLKEMQVADNELTHVGACLSNNKKLEKLNVAANYIWSLQEVALLSQLPCLRSILFSDVHFLSKQNPICRLKNHEMFTLYHIPQLQALNQTLLDSSDITFVSSTYQRKRLYYLLEQQQTRRDARDALKELERLHSQFRLVVKESRKFNDLMVTRRKLCGGASFFRWAAAETRKRRDTILHTRRYELEKFGNLYFELGDPTKTWYRRAAECLIHSFSPDDFSAFGFKSIRVISVHRIVNREADVAFELKRALRSPESAEEWVLCGTDPNHPVGLLRQCTSNMFGNLFAYKGLQETPLLFVSNGLAETDLARLHSLAANESFQAIAKQTLQLRQDQSGVQKEVPLAVGARKCTGHTQLSQGQEERSPLSLLQQAVRDYQMLLPDGEVLLCRALLHNSLPDTPLGYRAEEALIMKERGPSEGTTHKVVELRLTVACLQLIHYCSNSGNTCRAFVVADSPGKTSLWLFEPHCLVPHFLVRFSYSHEPSGLGPHTPPVTSNAVSSIPRPASPTRASEANAGPAASVKTLAPPQIADTLREKSSVVPGVLEPEGLHTEPSGGCQDHNSAQYQPSRGNHSGIPPQVGEASPFCDLISMAKYLMALHTRESNSCMSPRHPCKGMVQGQKTPEASDDSTRAFGTNCSGISRTSGEIVFGEVQLRELLLQNMTAKPSRLIDSSISYQEPSTPMDKVGGSDGCKVQLDRNDNIVSLSLSSRAHLIALSRGVLLTFLKLRVLLLPLNGLRNFEAPCESRRTSSLLDSPTAPTTAVLKTGSHIELPQLRVLDLSFNELCILDGFWKAPRLQQLCLVANHLLLMSDLAPLGTAAPQLRQLWLAGNPLHMGPYTNQHLQQLLPALELLDGRYLHNPHAEPLCSSLNFTWPCFLGEEDALAVPASADATDTLMQQQRTMVVNGPHGWALTAAVQHPVLEEYHIQRYCTCKAEDAQLLACSYVMLKMGPTETLGASTALEGLDPLPGLLGLSLLEELLLDGNEIASLDGIESLNHLECFDISHNKIVMFPPGMQHLKRLVFLCAEGNRLQQLEHLDGLPALTQLYLGSNNIQNFGSLMHLSRCPSLRVLDLRNTPLSIEAEYRPYSLYLLPSLKVLDGVESRQEEAEEIKQEFAGRLTRELLERIIGKSLPCLEGYENLRSTELHVAHNRIDIVGGGLGGIDGPGLLSLPLLEHLDLSYNSLRHLRGLACAPLGCIRILELRGNGLSKIEGLTSCCRLEVLDLSDNRLRRIEPEGFQGASETLRCLVLERNGLRSLYGFPFLPNLEELRIGQNRIPDFTQTECLIPLPNLRIIGFQQNPACQRRQWRALLSEQLPQLRTIDGEPISPDGTSRRPSLGPAEGPSRVHDTWEPLQTLPNENTGSALERPAGRGMSKQKQAQAIHDMGPLNLGVVGIGTPSIPFTDGTGSLLSRRESPLKPSGTWRHTPHLRHPFKSIPQLKNFGFHYMVL